ncbi:MAG: transcriptional regulator PpsR [Caldimonas sp.]
MKTSSDTPLDLGKLSSWAPELARTFVALASDIALVIDDAGVIRNVEQGGTEPIAPGAHAWVGQPWVDTVSGDTRAKIEKLLHEASSQGIARRREVNHPLQPGISLPVAYTAIRLGEHGPVLAVGRDMRAIAAIQERFIESQKDMERGYWSTRQAESGYRLLFQVATDAVMVVDPETLLILDANPAATRLFASADEHLIGKPATVGFAHLARGAVNELLAAARSSGQSGEIRARLLGSVASTSVAATSFRADDAMRLLVRVRSVDMPATFSDHDAGVTSLVEGDTDAVVVTDSSGRILLANRAFLGLVELGSEGDAKGRPLFDWLGGPDRPIEALISQVRRHGVVRRFASTAKPARGHATAVEVSAALLTEGDQECIGFTIRPDASPRNDGEPLPQSLRDGLEHLVGQLGGLPLPALVREAAALVERHFIELALRRSGGSTAAAALLLGVGREQLEVPRHSESTSAVLRPAASNDAGAK